MSLEARVCKVCGIDEDGDKVLLCDTEWCNAEYHTYCLNPPLFEIPQGNWYCPACMLDQPKGVELLQFVDKSFCEEARQLLDIVTALEETEYWQLEAQKKINLLKFLVDRSLETSLIRKHLGQSKAKLPKKLLGTDCVGRVYWDFPYISTHGGIVVNEVEQTELNLFGQLTSQSQYNNCGKWYLFECEEEISKLVSYLSATDPSRVELIDFILQRNKPTGKEPVPKTSSKPLLGMSPHILRQLRIKLLDMEAALPEEAKRHSMASPEWRSEWCAFVKSATTMNDMVEATLALENMIKTDHVNNTWWWYWSSVSAATKTPTNAALALRIHILDAAIKWPEKNKKQKKTEEHE